MNNKCTLNVQDQNKCDIESNSDKNTDFKSAVLSHLYKPTLCPQTAS